MGENAMKFKSPGKYIRQTRTIVNWATNDDSVFDGILASVYRIPNQLQSGLKLVVKDIPGISMASCKVRER